MLVRAMRQCDVQTGGQLRALFPGQFYDVPDGDLAALLRAGHVVESQSDSSLPGVPHVRGRAKAKEAE